MEDKPTQGGSNTPSEADVSRMIRAEVQAWTPRRGPDWSDLMIRIAGRGPAPWVVYTSASAALVVILFAAFLVGTWFNLGGFAPQQVNTHIH
ncbi:MAG TPA: hypothetical protein VJT78_14595 [Candidatus Dormibacteraeota bacterium]|nr:hypothetical protein [Candidatus Dormibacteraeota bacterium]